MASPLLLMTGPASSGGGTDCCPGSIPVMAPLFHTRRHATMATPIVMSRAIEHATTRPDHPCWEKRGPPEGGAGDGSEEGDGNQVRRRAQSARGSSQRHPTPTPQITAWHRARTCRRDTRLQLV